MAKIEFEDKVALIDNPDIPDINKVKATDMNEIKSVVNENDDKFLTNGLNVSNEVDEEYRVNLLETKNLFDKNNALPNSRLDASGNVITDTSYYCSQFIKVKPNTKYTFSANESIIFTYCTYDSNKTFIERTYPSGTSATITTGANVEYIRTQTPNANLNYFQLELGETATTYEAFIPNQIVVDNEKYTDTLNVGNVVDSRSRVNFLKSKNLYNNKTDLTNTIVASDGSLTTAEGYVCSQLISVKPSSTYSISYVNLSASEKIIRIGYYQQDGTPITRTTIGENGTITTQSNCYYIRVSYLLSTNKNVQVEEGSVITSYQPYDYASIYVDNKEIYSKPVVLWTNPSPTSNFANQTITLASDNYDYFDLFYKQGTSSSMVMCTRVLKGYGTRVILSSVNSSYAGGLVYQRTLTRTNDTTYTLGDCSKQSGTTVDTDNASLIPIQIIGYK